MTAIYFQSKTPVPSTPTLYTYIAAAATFAGTMVSIYQAFAAEKESKFIKQILSYLARSVPSSIEWKNQVRERIQQIAKAKGFSLLYAFSDQSTMEDPDARWLLWFSANTGASDVCGLAVIFPQDFSNLSVLSGRALDKALQESFFDSWLSRELDFQAASERIVRVIEAIYGLAHFRQGFKVAEALDPNTGSLQVEVGKAELTLNKLEFKELCGMPCLAASLQLAKRLQQADSEVANFLVSRIQLKS
jgi:hypothetical protein